MKYIQYIFIILIISDVLHGMNTNTINFYVKKEASLFNKIKDESKDYFNNIKNNPGALLGVKVFADAVIGSRFIRKNIYLVKPGHKVPKMNLFIAEAFSRGRDVYEQCFENFYTKTDMHYNTTINELREGLIRNTLEARDFSFGHAGKLFGELLKKELSTLPALKVLGVGIGLEHILEERYINHLFPTDKDTLENLKIKDQKSKNDLFPIDQNPLENKRNNNIINNTTSLEQNISFDHFNQNSRRITKLNDQTQTLL